jgi:4-aminobutyrate aminotransferase-like enzyme/Ser/Thr protein kinase RdoA (MazF antagonist)
LKSHDALLHDHRVHMQFRRFCRNGTSVTAASIDEVRFLDIAKPDVSEDAAMQVLENQYGMVGKLRPLESERDLNFRVATADAEHYLLKISNHDEPPETIDFEIAALRHIADARPELPVPRILTTLDGGLKTAAIAASGEQHAVRLLSFLPGTVLSDVPRTAALVFDQGRMAAKMALALRGFYHPAAGSRKLLWDVRESHALKPIAESLADPRERTLILRIIERFEQDVKPGLAALRAQIAHMDMTRYNMLVDESAPEKVSGILDFGDMHHGPLIQDVAVALADVMVPGTEPLAKAQAFLRGYQHVLPLQPDEIDALFDLLLAYFATYYLILMRRGKSYFASDRDEVVPMLERLERMGHDTVTDLFRQACGHPRPQGVKPGDVATLIARRRKAMGESMYVFYDPPLNLVKGSGVWLYDSAGKPYLDMYNNVPLVGHAHPYVGQAIARQTALLNTNTRYICDEIIAYAEQITATLPPELGNVQFVNSGSEANDLAWLMAEACTGNRGAIVVEDAYHGWTKAVAALSPSNKPGAPLAAHVRTVPAPDRYRSPRTDPQALLTYYGECVDRAIVSLAEAGMRPALCIVDAAFCSNGISGLLPGYLPMLFDKVREAGGLCVADEVQSGFGRMGDDIWGFRLHGVVPDIVTLGKPMANGYPMGAVITRPDILAAVSDGGAVFATFGGNNVAAAAACAVLDVFLRDDLRGNSARLGRYLASGLQALATKHDIVGDVRGSGLILGVELVLDRKQKTPAADQTGRLLQIMSENGVLLGSDGPLGNVLKIRPPLVFNREHADLFLQKLDAAFATL